MTDTIDINLTNILDFIKSSNLLNYNSILLYLLTLDNNIIIDLIISNNLIVYLSNWLNHAYTIADDSILKNILNILILLPGTNITKESHREIDNCLKKLCAYEKNEDIQAIALSLLSEWHNIDQHIKADTPMHLSNSNTTTNISLKSKKKNNNLNIDLVNKNLNDTSDILPLFIETTPSKKKKKVSWAPDDQLCQLREFITDKQLESKMSTFSLHPTVTITAEITYSPPPFLTAPKIVTELAAHRGIDSQEKHTQAARIHNVLEAIYAKLPDNPSDLLDPSEYIYPIPYEIETRIRIIPLDKLQHKIEMSRGYYDDYPVQDYNRDLLGKRPMLSEDPEELARRSKFNKTNEIISTSPITPPCTFFISKDGCKFGLKCKFPHINPNINKSIPSPKNVIFNNNNF